MGKQLVGLVIILLLLGAAVLFWWQDQKDVINLNKGLPEGIKVTESLIGNEYKVVNKIDGYSFKLPKEWAGVGEVKYIPESLEENYRITSINIDESDMVSVAIDRFELKEDSNLELSAKKIFSDFELIGEFSEDNIRDMEILKTQESVHLLGDYVYFFKIGSIVYSVTSSSEESIREIISNGKW